MTARKRRSSQAPRVRLFPLQANGPGPVPRLGMGPETPRVSKEGKLHVDSRGLGPPVGVRDLLRPSGPPALRGGPEPPRGPEARARARAFRWKTRAPTAFNAVGQGVLCRRGARDSLCQASLCTAYYQGAQCSRLCRTRAEPVCSIKWIRRHGTFPSCRLCRKLHRPLKLRGRRRQASSRQDIAWT